MKVEENRDLQRKKGKKKLNMEGGVALQSMKKKSKVRKNKRLTEDRKR